MQRRRISLPVFRRCLLAALVVLSASARAADSPTVAIWYHGDAAGLPRADDLAGLRAIGFSVIVWPAANTAGLSTVQRLAHDQGLQVVVRDRPAPVTPESALAPREVADIQPGAIPASLLWPLAWRAIAHGARIVAFEAGSGRAFATRNPQWLPTAAALSRQLHANGALLGEARAAVPVQFDRRVPAGLDAALLETPKAWLLVATNTSGRRVRGTARLPPVVPYAMWLNLIDGSSMAMLERSEGPEWVFDLAPWGVRVYVIDRTLR